MTRLRPIVGSLASQWASTIARLSEAAPLCGVRWSVVFGQAVSRWGVEVATARRWNSTRRQTLFSKRLARLNNHPAYQVHTFPSSTGGQEGDLVTPEIGPIWHGATFPFRFSVLLTVNAATAMAASASDYLSPHSLIGFQRYSFAVMLGCAVGTRRGKP